MARARASADGFRSWRLDERWGGRTPVRDSRVLAAMAAVPRHLFVPAEDRRFAYADAPQPIGCGQTISQPYMVAVMSEALAVGAGARVLEVGTGCGYQAAVLAELGARVWSVEIVADLAAGAAARLAELGYDSVTVRQGDGAAGWSEHAPFDGIIVTCAVARVPATLWNQLAAGGRLVIPLGDPDGHQELTIVERLPNGGRQVSTHTLCRFVPMTGEAWREG